MTSRDYQFAAVEACNMCGASPDRFKLLGLRLNRSQGMRPKAASGIAVSVKRCLSCDLIFSDPQPIPDDPTMHYGLPPESYWQTADFSIDDSYFRGEIIEAKKLLDFQPGMKALDIGAGVGKCMVALSRAGFQVSGIEPSAPFRDRAISQFGLSLASLAHAGIEDADFAAGEFDFITFGAVLEHLYNPAESLRSAMRWLKPGGVIHAEVPSSSHLIARIVNSYFRLRGTNYVTNLSPMHPPFHLFEFGLRSFELNGARLGYEIARHHYMVCSIYHLPRLLHPLLRAWMARTNTGMQLTLYLRKTSPV
jgi:SAM-dependent methyltransferase